MDSGPRQHVHQGIDTEEVDPPPDEIADPWLRNAKELGGLRLSEVAILDELTQLDHEARMDSKVLGFGFIEAKVGEDVTARRSYWQGIVLGDDHDPKNIEQQSGGQEDAAWRWRAP